jgi:hypothetical protein
MNNGRLNAAAPDIKRYLMYESTKLRHLIDLLYAELLRLETIIV